MMRNNECALEQVSALSWDKRLHQALDRYAQIDDVQPEIITALTIGLRQWAELLPCCCQGNDGCYLPVNTWGLGAEKTEIYALVDWLILQNKSHLADSLRKKFEAVHETAAAIDENFPKLSPFDEAAEKRLVKIGQRQTAQLISFLMHLLKKVFTLIPRKSHSAMVPISTVSSHRKRSQRAADIEVIEKVLIDHIKAAREYAWADIDAGKSPLLLPRPLKKDMAKQTGIKFWSLSRCFSDSSAHQLRLLWEVCNDLQQIIRFKKR